MKGIVWTEIVTMYMVWAVHQGNEERWFQTEECDDMIITGNDKHEISHIQEYLATEFDMKNLGGLKYFLGIKVARSQQSLVLCQRKYALDLLTDTGILDCKPVDTPIVQNHHLFEYPDQVPTNKERYQRLVGRLIYLSHTRPNIAYVMKVVNWASSVIDKRSTSGYFKFVGGNSVTWKSKKRKVVPLSRAEPEHEAFWELTGFGVMETPKLSELGARAIPGWVTHWDVAREFPETKP
ncbi:unnamed protein product [Prunus armeniaca]